MDLLAGILPIMCANHADVQFIVGEFLVQLLKCCKPAGSHARNTCVGGCTRVGITAHHQQNVLGFVSSPEIPKTENIL